MVDAWGWLFNPVRDVCFLNFELNSGFGFI